MKSAQPTLHYQSGLTIVELMVSLAIGLILMGGMVQIFSTNKNAYRYNVSLAEMQDNGNYSLEYMTNQINQIGYVPNWSGYHDADHNQDKRKNRQDMEWWAYGAKPPVEGIEGGGEVSDAITINVLADPNDGPVMDCVGNRIAAPGNFPAAIDAPATWVGITNALVARTDASGRSALLCNGIEIAEGIENMQIVYGVDTLDPDPAALFPYDGRVDRYLRWDEISAADRLNILTVRIALLTTSNEQTRAAENRNSYDLVGTEVTASGDRKLRSVYTATIRLRNRCARFSVTNAASPLCA